MRQTLVPPFKTRASYQLVSLEYEKPVIIDEGDTLESLAQRARQIGLTLRGQCGDEPPTAFLQRVEAR